ncbi:MAG: putative metal-binding motif-containing protein, partial [Pseudomonadota bacterium]
MHRLLAVLPLALLAAACRTEPAKPDDTGLNEDCSWFADADGDGFGDPGKEVSGPCSGVGEGYVRDGYDCDDTDPEVHPGATEVCNGIDDDCDGTVDADAADAATWYLDGDGDGFGDPDLGLIACDRPAGYIDDGTDCDDGDADIHPGAAERCDGLDNDCDGEVDEDVQGTWYADVDGDGYGDPALSTASCDPGAGWVAEATDCDDGDPAVFPGAEEVCNEVDDDCDGAVDEDLGGTWYRDADGDGYGDPAMESVGCAPDSGWVADGSDCDDANSRIHPAADERCNGYDDDCDGLIDDEDPGLVDASIWYADADADAYGDDSVTTMACEEPEGFTALGGDCDDADPAFNPGATEDDCADPNDYNCDGSVGYADVDADGWAACEECDDGDASIFPGADEWCDGVDNDCDGTVDEDDALDAATWFADADGDEYGDAASTTVACDEPAGFVADDTDCDDTEASVNPAAAERCDGIDQDCDGVVDDGVLDTFWADADGDGFGDAGSPTEACTAPSGFVADDTDCDDTHAGVYPGADEHCDGVDEDCDGYVDEAGAVDEPTWYDDSDGDGFGDPAAATPACTAPSGTVADDTDCDDADAGVYPGADEHCDGVD